MQNPVACLPLFQKIYGKHAVFRPPEEHFFICVRHKHRAKPFAFLMDSLAFAKRI